MRSRLSWFINTLLNFLTTYVIHAEVSRFHKVFRRANSLDEMIQLHEEHLEKIRGRCLLRPNTSALHRAILSVLDMCLHFSEGFIAFAGDTTATLDVSRHSIIMKRRRSRRQKQQRKNVIGFSQSFQDYDDSTEEDDDEQDAEGIDHGHTSEPSYSILGASVTSDEDFSGRVERMSSELDGLVRFLRRGMENLAGGTSEAASAFGVLAFALEDWDI
jgi:gamma-tubulin complex component 5